MARMYLYSRVPICQVSVSGPVLSDPKAVTPQWSAPGGEVIGPEADRQRRPGLSVSVYLA